MTIMKNLVLLFVLLSCYISSTSQIIWYEDFTTPGAWNLNVVNGPEGQTPDDFVISNIPYAWYTSSCVEINDNKALCIQGGGGPGYFEPDIWFSGATMSNRNAISPTINCSGYNNLILRFQYFEGGDNADNAKLLYFDGVTWSMLQDLPKTTLCSQIPQWTHFEIALPASANNNPNVQIAVNWTQDGDMTAIQPGIGVDNIYVVASPGSSTLISSETASTTWCLCGNHSHSYMSNATFNPGNVFSVQLSDPFGSFASPTVIGSVISTHPYDMIPCTIPCTQTLGNAYRVRVVSSNPVFIGNDNGSDITIPASTTPTISINATVPSPHCQGDMITFNATLSNAGASPTFQWTKNGLPFGIATPPFSTTALSNGDVVNCIVKSSMVCSSPLYDTSNNLSFTVGAVPSLTLSVIPTSTICSGNPVTITGFGGQSYQIVPAVTSGVPFIPTSNTTYTITAIASNGCTSSLTTPVTVINSPVVGGSVTPSNIVCEDDMVTLNGSGAVSYSWTGGVSNNVPFSIQASSVYTVTGTASNGCTSTSVVAVTANPNLPINVSLSTNPNPAVIGQNTTYTLNTGGIATYQIRWYKNGSLVSTTNNPNNQYQTIPSSLNDTVYAVIIPTGCYQPDSSKSSTISPQFASSISSFQEKSMTIYPNPVSDILQIYSEENIERITIRNLTGQTLYEYHIQKPVQEFHVSVNSISNGMYWIELETSNHRKQISRVLIQH